MTDWDGLIRAPLREVGPYVPGSSAAEMRARYGIDDLARLNWNEGLFGPLPGVLEAAAASLEDAWMYPEAAYGDLIEAIAGWLGVPPGQVLPGHGIQALVMTIISAFVSPGDRVVVPRPTYGLYAPACQAAGADVRRVDAPGLRFDLERIAAAARECRARLVWICDPNNPTGARLEPAEWAAFLDALPADCVAIADEAYVDYIPPDERTPRARRGCRGPAPDRAADVLEGVRDGRATARLRGRRSRARDVSAFGPGAVQRERRRARRGSRRARPSRACRRPPRRDDRLPRGCWSSGCARAGWIRRRRRRTSCWCRSRSPTTWR